LELSKTLHDDRHRFEEVDVPVVTTSASFRRAIARSLKEEPRLVDNDIVLSRAHFSMAVGVMREATERKLTAWLVDPINYVSDRDWKKIILLVQAGYLVAKFPVLKQIKDFLDTVARGKLPLTQAITSPLLYATERASKPIISLHYETGNILARDGKKVLQVITDPHIRPQYLYEAQRENIYFAVFDRQTKDDFLARAERLGKSVDPKKVVVTGPPVDPRIVKSRRKKDSEAVGKRGLRLAVTTGGLGQNKTEIEKALRSIAPQIKGGDIRVVLYASTLLHFKKLYSDIAREFDIREGSIEDEDANVRILYYPSIIDANQALIDHVFGWADGFLTKPSGDMAYDAAAAGCFLLLLEPWGEWEENVGRVFTNLGIAQKAEPGVFDKQIGKLSSSGWIRQAIDKALNLDPLFLNGAKKIVDLQQTLGIK
ncbi:MAG: hypothetical protein HYS83_01960, partial [Candidatus Blackburnbacteria bacterium]|nr:hypothetical protein [Candidatus Blackburnbacteria bacterium]